jgi:hypothetical protein
MGSTHKLDAGRLDRREFRHMDRRSGNPNQIPSRPNQIPGQAHRLAHPASRPIPFDCVAYAPADRETAPAERLIIGQHAQHQQRMCVAYPRLSHLPESFLVRQAIPALHLNTIANCGLPAVDERTYSASRNLKSEIRR